MQEGMEAMDGPVNFGERDRWWGMITQGYFTPLYCMNYNPPLLCNPFWKLRLQTFYNQVCFGLETQKPLSQKVIERHRIHAANPDISFSTIKKTTSKNLQLILLKYTTRHGRPRWFKAVKQRPGAYHVQKMKPVMDEDIVYFVYHKGVPISMFINPPDINQYFKHFNGKFGLLQNLNSCGARNSGEQKFVGMVFGTVPEWQSKGIDAYIIGECARIIQKPNPVYTDYEMQWIGDFNVKMINVAESLGETFRSRQLHNFPLPCSTEQESSNGTPWSNILLSPGRFKHLQYCPIDFP